MATKKAKSTTPKPVQYIYVVIDYSPDYDSFNAIVYENEGTAQADGVSSETMAVLRLRRPATKKREPIPITEVII